MSDPTLAVYEQRAGQWREERVPRISEREVTDFAAAASERGVRPIVDLGCGPGWYTQALGPGAVALDGAASMLAMVPDYAPDAHRVRADLTALPFRRGALGGAYGSKSYVHLPRSSVPLALADLHRSLHADAPAELVLFGGDQEHAPFPDDEYAGRLFSLWTEDHLRDVLHGSGFTIDRFSTASSARGAVTYRVRLRRARTLADTVGPDMRLLVCGLNPSLYAADAGIPFARPGNRFWKAATAAGVVHRDRDPVRALQVDGVGLTDLVKRATRAAAELTVDEYREGLVRVERLTEWLAPRAVCFVGLQGWRSAVNPRARAGVQPGRLGGAAVYVMPSTSGLNAHHGIDDLTEHLRQAARLADDMGG